MHASALIPARGRSLVPGPRAGMQVRRTSDGLSGRTARRSSSALPRGSGSGPSQAKQPVALAELVPCRWAPRRPPGYRPPTGVSERAGRRVWVREGLWVTWVVQLGRGSQPMWLASRLALWPPGPDVIPRRVAVRAARTAWQRRSGRSPGWRWAWVRSVAGAGSRPRPVRAWAWAASPGVPLSRERQVSPWVCLGCRAPPKRPSQQAASLRKAWGSARVWASPRPAWASRVQSVVQSLPLLHSGTARIRSRRP